MSLVPVWTVHTGFSRAPRCSTGCVIAASGGHLHQGW